MAVNMNTGMQKADMKKLLMRSKSEPVNCAIGLGDNAGLGLLMMHRTKTGKACESMLKAEFPDAKNLRWGTAFVDVDDNPNLVKITLNRPVAGMAKRLTKTLKGTGFTKVVLVLDDGSSIEAHEEADELAASATPQPAAPASAVAEASTGVPPPPAPPPPPAGPTPAEKAAQVAALSKLLATLATQIPAAAGQDAERKAALMKFAGDANVNLKTGNLVYAATALNQLKIALEGKPPAAPASAAPASAATIATQSRIAWGGAQRMVEADVERLRDELAKTYAGQPFAAEIDAKFQSTVAPVLETFDDSLMAVLDQLEDAADPQQRAPLIAEARAVLKKYLTYAMSEKLILDLDANPFVPLTIRNTVTTTLSNLAKTLV